LAYKFYQFDNYAELKTVISFSNIHWLVLVLLLLPVNWLIETCKWRYLCAAFEKISFSTSLKSVLAGLTTGFLSPNRIGEIIGRPLFLKAENRLAAAMMTVINGFSQTITIVACGIPSAVFFFFYFFADNQPEYRQYTLFCAFFMIVFLLIYIALPKIARWFNNRPLKIIAETSVKKLLVLLIYSVLRYAVFCLQFYFILFLCGVSLSPFEAMLAITLNYLFITITPSFSVSEAVIRVSYAVYFIGFFSGNVVGIACAGLLLWIINFVLPMLAGMVFLAKSKI
jgi:hypothetical protein